VDDKSKIKSRAMSPWNLSDVRELRFKL